MAVFAFLFLLSLQAFALFADGTKILTSVGPLAIEKLDVSMSRVMVYHKEWRPSGILPGRTFAPGHENQMLSVLLAGGVRLVVTANQTFMLSNGQMISAANIKPGATALRGHDGQPNEVLEVKSVVYDGYLRTVRAEQQHLIDAGGIIAGDDSVFESQTKPMTVNHENLKSKPDRYNDTVRTALTGNVSGGKRSYEPNAKVSQLEFLEVAWDADKICKIRWRTRGEREHIMGRDCSNYRHITFKPETKFKLARLLESRWGGRSLRGIEFQFADGPPFFAGPAGYDRDLKLEVPDGFFVNDLQLIESPAGFIQAMGLQISKSKVIVK